MAFMGEKPVPTDQPGLGDLFEKLLRNIRTLVFAELGLLQTTYLLKLKALQMAALAIAVGALVFLCALVALLVGLMMGLAPLIGPFFAALAVGLGGVVLGAAIVVVAGLRLGHHFSTLLPGDEGNIDPVENSDAH